MDARERNLMDGQMTIGQYQARITHDRYGRPYDAPSWMDDERCETCKYWERFPVELQPPAGWGVYGQCDCIHEPEMMKNGYWQTGKTSYCNDFESRNQI